MGLPEPSGSEEMPCGIDIWASWGPVAEVGSGSSEGNSTWAEQSGAAELRKEVCALLPCCLPFSHEGLPLAEPKRTACCGPSVSHTPLTPGHLSNSLLSLSLQLRVFHFLFSWGTSHSSFSICCITNYLQKISSVENTQSDFLKLNFEFKYEGEIKSFSDKQKLGEFCTTKPALQIGRAHV